MLLGATSTASHALKDSDFHYDAFLLLNMWRMAQTLTELDLSELKFLTPSSHNTTYFSLGKALFDTQILRNYTSYV